MARFLIEVPHSADQLTCARAVEVFLKTGSHYMTNADWGCKDGVHKSWITVDVDSRDEARSILPPAFRDDARIIQLNYFTMDEIEPFLRHFKP